MNSNEKTVKINTPAKNTVKGEVPPRLTASLTSFDKIQDAANASGIVAYIARQYMTMYRYAKAKARPMILELGTREGISTSVFLEVCQENGGKVVSVDINDCSGVSTDVNWCFVQSDSTDVENILTVAPVLNQGIDILLIDSLHVRSHVEKEFFSWYPYLKEGAIIFFDDVDPFIYRNGSRKDNLYNEFNWQDLHDFVIEIFRANEETMRLSIHYGSSGLAVLEKISPMGELAVIPPRQVYRDRQFWFQLTVYMARLKQRLYSSLRQ